MDKIAALLLVVGSGCHIADPKGLWSNCIWIASIFTSILAVLAARDNGDHLWLAVKISAVVLFVFVELGFVGLIKEVKSWPDD